MLEAKVFAHVTHDAQNRNGSIMYEFHNPLTYVSILH